MNVTELEIGLTNFIKFIPKLIFKIILPILIVLIGGYYAYQCYGGNLLEDITEL